MFQVIKRGSVILINQHACSEGPMYKLHHFISSNSVWHNLLDSQVNVLLDAEAKVAVVGEVLLPQLVLLNLEAPLQNLLSLIFVWSIWYKTLPNHCAI